MGLAINRTEQLLEERGIQVSGHFVLRAGDHSDSYMRKDLVIANTHSTEVVADQMARIIGENVDSSEVDALVSIAPCSAVLGSQVGRSLSKKWDKELVTVFAEKVPELDLSGDKPKIVEPLKFKRGYDELLEGLNGFLIEDIVSTAATLFELMGLVRPIPGFNIVGASAIANRNMSKVTKEYLGVPLWLPLVTKDVRSWPEDECELCEDLEANPINTQLGKGAKYLAERA